MIARSLLQAVAFGLVTHGAVALGVAVAQEGPIGRDGARLPIGITGTLPAYLELTTQGEAASQAITQSGMIGTRLAHVRVRANTPWQLTATVHRVGVGGECALRHAGSAAGWTVLREGVSVVVPCEVEHFAGEHDLTIEWMRGAAGGPSMSLDLALAPTGGATGVTPESMRTVALTWHNSAAPETAPMSSALRPAAVTPTPIVVSDYLPAIVIEY